MTRSIAGRMSDALVNALIILVLIICLYLGFEWFRYGHKNTIAVPLPVTESMGSCTGNSCPNSLGGSVSYNVHREHSDTKAAAQLMQQITQRNATLIEHLESKYLGEKLRNFNPDHHNRIDVISGSNLYYADNPMEHDVASRFGKVSLREDVQERVVQLVHNYDANDIHEISPLNKEGSTSYTENKKTLILCLRRKKPDANGQHPLHDINTMMFVVLHELTHMMNNEWGHPYEFWVLFKFVLENAVECGIYTPVNYREKPIVYCGLDITYNPLFDPRLS